MIIKFFFKEYLALIFCFLTFWLNAKDSEFYFGKDSKFNPHITSPEAFLGFKTGTHHTRYDELTAYFKELARASENAELITIGHTYEGRPLLVLAISSVKNLSNLEQIRTDHLKITDPNSSFDHQSLPTINLLGFGVHGNESSAAEAAILTAYYLLGSEDEVVSHFLENGIYFIEPSRNPDGHDRHAHWVNSQKSKNLVADPADLEHNETYPGGRSNHYWFDLNRDWLPAIHVESKARLAFYHSWIPHLVTCHHEMGTNSTFFFEPTKPIGNESPIVPKSHYEMNNKFAGYFATALDDIGSLYYTKENFDNFNPTFGSSYPDYNGSLAILFEQGSSRGFVQERTVGEITFQSAIKNQLTASIASIRASFNLKNELIANQKNFFKSALENGARSKIKAYIFGDPQDQNRTLLLVELLKRHRIQVFENTKNFTSGDQTFFPGKSFIVPGGQAQNRLVELFFNKDLSVPDSVFYDGSSWTVVLAFGLPYAPLYDKQLFEGKQAFEKTEMISSVNNKSEYAYLVRWSDYNSPAFLSGLFKKDIVVYTSLKPFSSIIGGRDTDFGYGTLVIPVREQEINSDELYSYLTALSKQYSLEVYPAATGYNTKGIDLGSNNVKALKKPEILILTGPGISSLEAGEAWFLIDNHLDVAVTRTDITGLGRIDLKRYTTIVLPGVNSRFGGVPVNKTAISRLKNWIAEGGTLIALNRASEWVIQNELSNEKLVSEKSDSSRTTRFDYADQSQIEGSKVVGGTVLNVDVDISHPLAFGLASRNLPILKNNTLALKYSTNPYNTVATFTNNAVLSGYIRKTNLDHFTNTSALLVSPYQRGCTILFTFNPIHRASWHSSARLFYNSIYFSQLLNGSSARY